MEDRTQHTWTEEEIDLLGRKAGLYSYDGIGKVLGRTPGAIQRSLFEQFGTSSAKLAMGYLSCNQLAKSLNVDFHTVARWRDKHNLPLYHMQLAYARKDRKRKTYYIFPEDFWKWAEDHKEFINFHRIERHCILPEPEWLEEEMKKPNYKTGPYSEEEDEIVWYLYYNKAITQVEIAKKLNRTRSSVEKRLARLRMKKGVTS